MRDAGEDKNNLLSTDGFEAHQNQIPVECNERDGQTTGETLAYNRWKMLIKQPTGGRRCSCLSCVRAYHGPYHAVVHARRSSPGQERKPRVREGAAKNTSSPPRFSRRVCLFLARLLEKYYATHFSHLKKKRKHHQTLNKLSRKLFSSLSLTELLVHAC